MNTTIIQFTPSDDYNYNLDKLVNYIKTSTSKLIVAPEVCVTGFDYANFQKANKFANTIKDTVLALSDNKIIVFSVIEDNKNYIYVFYNQKIIYKRAKIKLFGYEKRYFEAGNDEVEIFEVDGIKFGVLVCFEVRFIEYWQKLRGVDVVLIPAMWGEERKEHLITLSMALALSLQSYVVVSDGLAKSSSIIDPWAKRLQNTDEILTAKIDFDYIYKIRKRFKLE